MSMLRDDYDPTDTPLNSSAIFKVDTSLFELEVEETPEHTLRLVVEPESEANKPEPGVVSGTSALLKLQRVVNRFVYRIYTSRVFLAVFATLLLLSLALLAFSLTYRVEHIDDNLDIMAELGSVEMELLQLRNTWSGEAMQQLADKVRKADQKRVFNDYQSLAIWLREKSIYAEQLDLTFAYQLGDARGSGIEDMLEVPIKLQLQGNASAQELYLRALQFLKIVVGTAWYIEINEAALSGNGNESQNVEATLRVWVHGSLTEEASIVQQ